jgi:hypothetical protein
MQAAIVYAYEKPTQRNRFGEIPEACRGHQDMACMERGVEELGRPRGLLGSPRQTARRKAGEALKGKPGPGENAWCLNVERREMTGRRPEPRRQGRPKILGESDQPIVLRERESRSHGEGADGNP